MVPIVPVMMAPTHPSMLIPQQASRSGSKRGSKEHPTRSSRNESSNPQVIVVKVPEPAPPVSLTNELNHGIHTCLLFVLF